MTQSVDTVVLYNELACYEVLPVHWQPLREPPDRFAHSRVDESNLLLLQACVAVEDHTVRDKHDDTMPLAAELARLDFKLNLALKLLGALLDVGRSVVPVPVRFNATGASWESADAPAAGSRGMIGIRLLGYVPESLELYSEITGCESGLVSARFLEPAAAVVDLIQQLCFLKHRKQVAGARKSQGS